MKRNNIINFKPKFHKPIGASECVPNLTLPVHEMVERLTDHTLDDIRAKSMLHGDYFPTDPNADLLEYADRMCLAETCIDLTDQSRIREEVARQIEIMKASFSQSQVTTTPEPTKVVTPEQSVNVQ